MSSGAFTFFVVAMSIIVLTWAIRYAARGTLTSLRNPRPHRFADDEYFTTELSGTRYAFTAEQLAVARDRAHRLNK